jgi:lycopene cyclase domain-containing protein
MTYLGFHALLILPPLVALAWLGRGSAASIHPRAGVYLAAMGAIALAYTTPWDNYLVWRGVWSYGTDRVIGTIGYVPVEEYLFFLLQPLLAGLWLFRLLPAPAAPTGPRARWVGAALYVAAGVAGLLLLRSQRGTYLGLILVWAAPVLAAQWAWAGGEIWARRRAWAIGVAVPTVYLWVADAIAIRAGVWRISEAHTLGPAIGPLPLEEMAFFLVTNLLVTQGLLLFLYPPRAAPAPAASPARVGAA